MRSNRVKFASATALAGLLCAGTAAAQTTESAAEAVAEARAPERKIDIMNYRVQGNSVLANADIEKAVYPYLGPQRSTDDVEKARAALEQAYRAKGYETVGVEIPEQDVRAGVVVLKVVEMKVGRLRVADSRYFSPEDIKARAPSLAEGAVPNYNAVSRDLAALNRSADRTVTPTLRAGSAPGTIDVDLTVDDKRPVRATFELNDRYSNRTERLRLSAGATYANLFQREHSLSVQTQFAPEDPGQTWVVSASYLAPIQGTPFNVVGYGVHSSSDVSALGGIGVIGSGDIVGLRLIANLPARGAWVQQLIGGVDYKSFDESLVLGSDTASTPIDYLPLTIGYSATKATETSTLNLSASLNFGIRGIGATDTDFRLKRFNASASWAAIKFEASLDQTLPRDFKLISRFSGQYSRDPLISNEQFGAGGLDSVRGYFESQELGDYGLQTQLQLESPSLHKGLKDPNLHEWRFYGFVDSAWLGVHDPLPDLNGKITEHYGLTSVGLGSRIKIYKYYNMDILLAAPLLNPEETKTDIKEKLRGQFRFWAEF